MIKLMVAVIAMGLLLGGLADNVAAQTGRVSIENITGTSGPNTLMASTTHQVTIRYDITDVPDHGTHWWTSNGFEIYSPNGADWDYLEVELQPFYQVLQQRSPTFASFQRFFTFDGSDWSDLGPLNGIGPGSSGPDSRTGFQFSTVDVLGTGGFLPGVDNEVILMFEFRSDHSDDGLTICFDTCDAITAWEWSDGTEDYPIWDNGLGVDGPRCLSIGNWVGLPPDWCDQIPEGQMVSSYCTESDFQLCAVSPNFFPMTYMLLPPYDDGSMGSVDPETGHWTSDRHTVKPGDYDLQFQVHDWVGMPYEPFTLHLTITGTGCDCCVGTVGNANSSIDEEPTIGDISTMVDFLFITRTPLECYPEADYNQSGGMYPIVDDITIGDISSLIDCIFITGLDECVLPPCIQMQ